MGSHDRILNGEVTCSDLCHNRIPLAAVLRINCKGGGDRSREPGEESYRSHPGDRDGALTRVVDVQKWSGSRYILSMSLKFRRYWLVPFLSLSFIL